MSGLLRRLAPGEEVTQVGNGTEVATLRVTPTPPSANKRVPGIWKGMATIVSDDDEHLNDFAEYTS